MGRRPGRFVANVRDSGSAVADNGAVANTGILIGNFHADGTARGIHGARRRLTEMIVSPWASEAGRRMAENPGPMPVHWHVAHDRRLRTSKRNIVKTAWGIEFTADDLSPLVSAFRSLDSRRLVIIGDAGSGKTTLAVQVVRELLASRDEFPGEPIPILMTAANWDVDRFPSLRDWMAHHLAKQYPALQARVFGRNAPAELVSGSHVLPVVDGLDELPPDSLAAALRSLADFSGRDDHIILTCRTTEYRKSVRKSQVLPSALVVEPDPLSIEAAADYLERCQADEPGEGWESVLAALREPTSESPEQAILAGVVSSPLGLWLTRMTYVDQDPRELLEPGRFPDRAGMYEHLYDSLIPAVLRLQSGHGSYAGHPPTNVHDPRDIRRWLGYLATIGDSPDISWWQLARASGGIPASLRMGIGVLISVVAATLLAVPASMVTSPVTGTIGGVIFGLATGVGAGVYAGTWSDDPPGHIRQTIRGDIPGLAGEIVDKAAESLLVLFPAGGLLLVFARPISATIGLLLTFFIGYCISTGVISWTEAPSPVDRPHTPSDHLRSDRLLTLTRMAISGCSFGTGIMILVLYFRDLGSALIFGVIGGLGYAVTGGMMSGDHRQWLAYATAVDRAARRRRLPRRLMPFLQDAHQLGLLRTVGPAYQFRHAGLREYLARTYRENPD